jgi:DNA-directed RNA polymerase specialized sigma24 family protein
MVGRAAWRTTTIELDGVDQKESTFLEATLPHLDALNRVAHHLCADHHRAEDIVQETYLHAYASFGTHNGPSTRAWLLAICVNVARSEGGRRSRRVVEEAARRCRRRGARGRGPGRRRCSW